MGGYCDGRSADPAAGEMTLPNLQNLIEQLTSGEDNAAENAAKVIATLGESALPALFDCLDSTDPDKRWWALRASAEITHPTVPPQLTRFLGDPDPHVRQCAALGLSKQPWEDAIPILVYMLGDQDRLLSRLAGDALIAIGSQAVASLIDALEDGTPLAQNQAARALARIEDPSAIPALYKAWNSGSPMIQHWAEEGFERMGVGMQFFNPSG